MTGWISAVRILRDSLLAQNTHVSTITVRRYSLLAHNNHVSTIKVRFSGSFTALKLIFIQCLLIYVTMKFNRQI